MNRTNRFVVDEKTYSWLGTSLCHLSLVPDISSNCPDFIETLLLSIAARHQSVSVETDRDLSRRGNGGVQSRGARHCYMSEGARWLLWDSAILGLELEAVVSLAMNQLKGYRTY